MAKKTDYSEGKPQSVEALGFYHGSQHVPAESGQQQITADFERRKAQRRQESAESIKQLEARVQTLERLSALANEHWEKLQTRLGDVVPRFFIPMVMLLLGTLALAAETFLLAPALDMLGVADPLEQKLIAGPLCALAAIIFHYALTAFHERRPGGKAVLPCILAGATIIGLVILGVARARQMAFSASLNNNPLAEFMAEHTVLGTTLFVFLTLFFPIAAGVAVHEGTESARQWWEYVIARRRARILPRKLDDASKKLEGEEEKLDQDITAIEERRKEFTGIYDQYYALGEKNGAEQGPYWHVIAKAAGVGVLVFVTGALISRVFGPWTTPALMLSLLVGLVAGLLSVVYFHRVWAHPSPEQLLRRQQLQFVGKPDFVPPSPPPYQEPTVVDLYLAQPERRQGQMTNGKELNHDSWRN
jgi:hypothetical protein